MKQWAIVAIGLAIAFFWLSAALRNTRERERIRFANYARQLNEKWIAAEVVRLKSGQTSHVYFYSTANTDQLVAQLAGMAEVKRLTFQSTDIGDQGVEVVSKLINLEKLTIVGGNTSDVGLEFLSQSHNLRELHLVQLKLTDTGLAAFRPNPNLEYHSIYCSPPSSKQLSDKSVESLGRFEQLKKLNVGGGWLSTSGKQKMRSLLPDCEVVEKFADDEW